MNKSRRSKIRAPLSDRAYVVSPIDKLDSLINENRNCFTGSVGDSIIDLTDEQIQFRREEARQQLFDAATRYVSEYAPSSCLAEQSTLRQAPLILSGHQPEFFHPGVWFKNFLIAKLSQKCHGNSVNLIIDNDVCSSRSIAVPTGTVENPQRKMVAYDGVEPDDVGVGHNAFAQNQTVTAQKVDHVVPYETASWRDPNATRSFPSEVRAAISSLMPQEIILDLVWDQLLAIQTDCPNIGESIARSRHLFELGHQVRNAEVPLSHICKQLSFHRFLFDIFVNAKPFQALHNIALKEFRRLNKVRSQSHPVPSLVELDDWIELPFWIWSSESPWRGPLYVRDRPGRFELTDMDQIHIDVAADDGFSHDLCALDRQGIAIRPRALMTTMFARVFLADLFVHGIGGAKYDELTDRLIQQFYGIRPPMFLTASSTHLLPLGVSQIDSSELARKKQEMRSLRFHPEQHFGTDRSEDSAWIEKKNKLLANIPPRGQKMSWHLALEEANSAMQESVQTQLRECEKNLIELRRRKKKNALLVSREFSFLLHSPSLIQVLEQISDEAASKFI